MEGGGESRKSGGVRESARRDGGEREREMELSSNQILAPAF